MRDSEKTKTQLIAELKALRLRCEQLESSADEGIQSAPSDPSRKRGERKESSQANGNLSKSTARILFLSSERFSRDYDSIAEEMGHESHVLIDPENLTELTGHYDLLVIEFIPQAETRFSREHSTAIMMGNYPGLHCDRSLMLDLIEGDWGLQNCYIYRCSSHCALEWKEQDSLFPEEREAISRAIAKTLTMPSFETADYFEIVTDSMLHSVVESSQAPLIVTDMEGVILFANLSAQAMFDRPTHLMKGINVDDLFPDQESAQRFWDLAMRISRKFGGSTETWMRARDGRMFDALIVLNRVFWGDHSNWGFTIHDITDLKRAEAERRQLEAQIQHAQKLESLGVLAGGIAHDFNNLLMGILGNASLALMDIPPESTVRDRLEEIETGAQRAADLTRQLLAYSGKGKFMIKRLDLSRLVEEMGHLLKVSISKKVDLEYRFQENLPAIEGDPTQIRQVVMNLITNASDAIGDRVGKITVRTGLISADREYLQSTYLDENLKEGDYVLLEVSDDGEGMSEETKSRIFDPFFTTKFTGRGLGLAAVLGIVRGHNGAVRVYSEEGRGTNFKILFPSCEKPAEGLESRKNADPAWKGSGTILVVDDEDTVCQVARQILERSGFQVLLAEDGIVGLEKFRKHIGDIRAVLLDLTMPRMDGKETYREIRVLSREIPIILSSGYNEQDAATRIEGNGPCVFIQKPYRSTDLIGKVREVLER